MLIKAQLKKAPLCEWPTFDKKELEKAQYIATANIIETEKSGQVLVVDYYSSKDKKLQVRFFSDANRCISYLVGEDKWTEKAIYNLIVGECLSTREHCKLAASFLNISVCREKYNTFVLGYKYLKGIVAICGKFTSDIARQKNEKAYYRKWAKVQSHLSMFPNCYEDKLNDFCETKVFLNSYIFFSKLDKKHKRQGVCTHCKKHFELSADIKHGEIGTCPVCNSKIKYCAMWNRTEICEKATICYPLKKDSQLLIDFISVIRTSDADGNTYHNYRPVARTLYLKEKGKQKIYSYGWQNLPWYGYQWCKWGNRSVYKQAYIFHENLNDIFGDKYYNVNLQSVVSKEKHPFDFVALLDNLKNNPYCEYLCKTGLTKLASQIDISDCNENGSSFASVLGVTAQYIPLYKEMGISAQEHRIIQGTKSFIDAEWVKKYRVIAKKLNLDLSEILKKMSLNRFCTYLEKQSKLHKERTLTQIAVWIRDYIVMSEELGVQLNKRNLFPADIKQAHDVLLQRVNELRKVEAEEASKVALQFANSFFNGYEKDGLTVLMPKSRQDFIKEGQELSHCVGHERYYKNHISGQKMIFFIRRTDKPDTAYFTAEIDMVTFKVLQLYGYGDRLPSNSVRQFTKEFASYLRKETNKLRKAS